MLTLALIGLSLGCVYALMAMGFSSVYRTTGVLNFAQGSFVMFGPMSCSWMLESLHWPYPLAVVGALAMSGVLGLVVGLGIVVPLWLRGAPMFSVVLATLVVGLMIENIVLHWLGSEPRITPTFTAGYVSLAGLRVQSQYLWVVIGTVVIIAAFHVFLKRTLVGKAMRACAIDRNTSGLLGISPAQMGALAFVLAAVMGALGGLLVAPLQYTAFNVGTSLGIKGFVAAILGGLGSIEGAFVGGLLLGLLEVVTVIYGSTQFQDVTVFAVLLIVIILRPKGLLGTAWE